MPKPNLVFSSLNYNSNSFEAVILSSRPFLTLAAPSICSYLETAAPSPTLLKIFMNQDSFKFCQRLDVDCKAETGTFFQNVFRCMLMSKMNFVQLKRIHFYSVGLDLESLANVIRDFLMSITAMNPETANDDEKNVVNSSTHTVIHRLRAQNLEQVLFTIASKNIIFMNMRGRIGSALATAHQDALIETVFLKTCARDHRFIKFGYLFSKLFPLPPPEGKSNNAKPLADDRRNNDEKNSIDDDTIIIKQQQQEVSDFRLPHLSFYRSLLSCIKPTFFPNCVDLASDNFCEYYLHPHKILHRLAFLFHEAAKQLDRRPRLFDAEVAVHLLNSVSHPAWIDEVLSRYQSNKNNILLSKDQFLIRELFTTNQFHAFSDVCVFNNIMSGVLDNLTGASSSNSRKFEQLVSLGYRDLALNHIFPGIELAVSVDFMKKDRLALIDCSCVIDDLRLRFFDFQRKDNFVMKLMVTERHPRSGMIWLHHILDIICDSILVKTFCGSCSLRHHGQLSLDQQILLDCPDMREIIDNSISLIVRIFGDKNASPSPVLKETVDFIFNDLKFVDVVVPKVVDAAFRQYYCQHHDHDQFADLSSIMKNQKMYFVLACLSTLFDSLMKNGMLMDSFASNNLQKVHVSSSSTSTLFELCLLAQLHLSDVTDVEARGATSLRDFFFRFLSCPDSHQEHRDNPGAIRQFPTRERRPHSIDEAERQNQTTVDPSGNWKTARRSKILSSRSKVNAVPMILTSLRDLMIRYRKFEKTSKQSITQDHYEKCQINVGMMICTMIEMLHIMVYQEEILVAALREKEIQHSWIKKEVKYKPMKLQTTRDVSSVKKLIDSGFPEYLIIRTNVTLSELAMQMDFQIEDDIMDKLRNMEGTGLNYYSSIPLPPSTNRDCALKQRKIIFDENDKFETTISSRVIIIAAQTLIQQFLTSPREAGYEFTYAKDLSNAVNDCGYLLMLLNGYLE